jgi:uncharacterized membrane protein
VSTETFYTVVGGISFTLLGLWWVVVISRKEWQHSRARRMLAYAVSLHFLLPGMMSILSIVAPDEPLVWRGVFALAGLIGVVGVVLFRRALIEDHDTPRLAVVVEWVVLPIYIGITILALVPTIPATLGLTLTGIQVEAILVSLLLFFGVQGAWILMVEPVRNPGADRDDDRDGRG